MSLSTPHGMLLRMQSVPILTIPGCIMGCSDNRAELLATSTNNHLGQKTFSSPPHSNLFVCITLHRTYLCWFYMFYIIVTLCFTCFNQTEFSPYSFYLPWNQCHLLLEILAMVQSLLNENIWFHTDSSATSPMILT